MATYEAVCGIAESDNQYAYIAIRPPLEEQLVAEYAHATSPIIMDGDHVLRATMGDDVTELEIWSLEPHSSDELIDTLVAKLGSIVRLDGHRLNLLPGVIAVEGQQSLFDQHADQHRQLQATQNS